ncbi:hypothetical protein ACFY4C_42165 [Actinomadura viridis]|uniref:hypothetical protein n=1 Tax=Actinomadura viridis TaxID=58110 RepID=UPI0036A80AB1
MQVTPERGDGRWVSPAIPTIANCLLALLWGFSAAGGWAETAFCGEGESRDDACAAEFGPAVTVSVPPAVLAAVMVLFSWGLPGVRRRPERQGVLLTLAAVIWVLAEGILFAGGYLAKSGG